MASVLIVAHHWAVASGRYMRDAFIRAGAETYTLGTMQSTLWGMPVDSAWWWRPAPPPPGFEPDLVLLMDSDEDVQRQALAFPARKRAVYGVDNHVRRYIEGFDHYFLAHYHGPIQPIEAVENATWLPCAFDPTLFRPSPIAWRDREYDFCLVGVPYPERVRRAKMLQKAGYSVFFETGLLYQAYAEAYQNARISLCVSAAGDVAQRIFETAACGCLILSDPLLDLIDPKTNQQLGLSGFAFYHNDDELLIQAKALLGDEQQVALGGIASMLYSVRPHTWDARASTILKWLREELK